MIENATLDEQAAAQDRKLQIVRVIRTTRQKAFDAWTRPELMQRWFAPGTMTVANVSADLRVGGAYRVEMKGADDYTHVAAGVYTKIIPNERIAFTWGGACDPSSETLVTVDFKDVEGGTQLTLTHEHFLTAESVSKHEHGWFGCLEKLVQLLQA